MESASCRDESCYTIERRRFLESFAALGLATVLPAISACDAGTDEPAADDDGITVEMIEAAEKLIDIELTPDERRRLVKDLGENIAAIRALRSMPIDYDTPPSMVFNPVPPGLSLPSETREIRYSQVSVAMPRSIEDTAFLSVLELGRLLREGHVSSVRLTEMYLDRLKRYDPRLKFVVTLTEELAKQRAVSADRELRAGRDRGPLHGIPYGTKDLFAVRDYPTTWGTRLFRDRISHRNASVVDKLDEAGAVLVAKLSTGTLASGQEWFGGETKNPWDTGRGSGGSSAGPAAAVAAGCVGFAVGTESNGSMLSPCNECGVTGLRPTFGRVSRFGMMTTSWSFDKVTPICRTVEDCAAVFDAIRGSDGRDNSVVDLPFNWDAKLDIGSLRIGYHRRFFERELMGNPQRQDAIAYREAIRRESRNALDFFRAKGFDLVPLDFEIPHSEEGIMMMCESAAAADELSRSRRDDEVEDQKWPDYWRQHRFISAVDYLRAARYRSIVIDAMHEALKDVDVYIEITWSNNWTTNVTGHPAVVVPCGFLSENRPVTVTFVGQLYREAELLAVANSFQAGTEHHLRHPRL